jgi:twitching motility protein PilT
LARLDKLIQVMHDQRAEALQLAVGKPASLIQNGAARHLTREPLSDTQIQALLREIASPETAAQLGAAAPLSFAYRSPSGEVQVEMKAGAEGHATLRPTVPLAAPSPRQAQDLAGPRAELEGLFRHLVESGASDLHLRTGEPPMLRNHGELARQSLPALSADKLDAMLVSIMTPKELGEFREGGDTDWAYEITGVARFRCNAGRDRYGPMAVFRVIPNKIRTADEMGLSREVQNLCYLT